MLDIIDNVLFFDTETTGLWPWALSARKRAGIAPDRPFMFILANLNGDVTSWRAPVNPHTRAVDYSKCQKELRFLKGHVANPKMRVVTHMAQFEQRMTTQSDLAFDWRCKIDDTRIMARVCNPTTEWRGYGLKELARKYLKIPSDDEKTLKQNVQRARLLAKKRGWSVATKATHGKSPAAADYWLPGVEREVKAYGEMDGVRTSGLWQFYRAWLDENRAEGGRLWDVYAWERRLLHTSIQMERHGMTYLAPAGKALRVFYSGYMKEHRTKIDALGYDGLNLQSSPQMKKVFVEQLHYKVEAPSKTGLTKVKAGLMDMERALQIYPKLDAEQLMQWARGSKQGADVDGDGPDGCRLSRSILEWKAGKKVIEYIDSYIFFSCKRKDGSSVLHPGWDQAGARTGRFSCHDPNTQQIASAETSRRHSQIRARQRECFGPRPNYLWYMPDYSQIEVWVFAFVANEEAMKAALLRGSDFHLSTADAAWGRRDNFCVCGRWKEVQQELARNDKYFVVWDDEKQHHKKGCFIKWWRQRAKMLLFSRLYGGGLDKVAQLIRCSRAEASEFIDEFNENLPGVTRYMEELIEQVRDTGVLVNLFGREYSIERNKAYKSVNYMVQGSSAEIMKRSIVRVDRHLHKRYPGSYCVGTVHDELIAEIHQRHHSARLMSEIISLMQRDSSFVPNLPVLLPVGMKYTTSNWSSATDVKLLSFKRAA